MNTFQASPFLRRVLLADAVLAGGAGLLMALLATPLEPWLSIPASLLQAAGIGFVAFAILAAVVARSQRPARIAVWAVILVNVVGVVECVGLLLGNWISPSLLGILFVLALALVMAVFAALEYAGLKQSPHQAGIGNAAASRS